MSQKFNSSVRSRQSGLSFSIKAIFHARRQRFKDGIEGFKIDELIDFILLCETGNKLGFMFRQTPSEIVGDADIQRPISLTCEFRTGLWPTLVDETKRRVVARP